MSHKQRNLLTKLIFSRAADEDKILNKYQVTSIDNLSKTQASDCIYLLMKMNLQEHIFWELYGDQDPTRSDKESVGTQVA